MGLDVMVMPLTRYFGGAYQGPVEQLSGGNVQRVGSPKPSDSGSAASEKVETLRRLVSKAAGREVSWTETGEVAWSAQYHYQAYTYLRAYAASLEYPDIEPPRPGCLSFRSRSGPRYTRITLAHIQGFLAFPFSRQPPPRTEGHVPPGTVRPFNDEEDPCDHPSFIRTCEGDKTRFPHLIHHSDNQGFWVPVDFAEPIVLDAKSFFVLGSSTRLLAELDDVNRSLGQTKDWGQLNSGERASPEGAPLPNVRYGWSVLHAAARISVEKNMPVVFDG